MNNIKLLSKTVVVSNKWTKIIREKFSFENNQQGEFLIVERSPAIMILPLIQNGDQFYTYLVKQHRYPIAKNVWQFPMGTLDENKDPLKHAADELREETGLITQNVSPYKEYYVDPGLSRQKCIVYIAQNIIEGGKQELEASEVGMKAKRIAVLDLQKMIHRGEIIDLWGYTGIHLLLEYIQSLH